MRCKNCGADLKPGIKYCLECGSFLDEEDVSHSDNGPGEIVNNNAPIDFGPQKTVIRRKKRKKKMKTTDLLIYLGLGLVFVVSVIVIIVALVNGEEDQVVVPPVEEPVPEVKDKTVSVDDYKVTIDGDLSYDVQGSIIYISDNKNYTFTYRNLLDEYDKYSADMTLLSDDLKESNYQLMDSEKMTVNGREFLIYEIIANSRTKYLYVTKANKNYLSMGIIENVDTNNWKMALDVIDDLNSSIEFDTVYIEREITTTEIDEILVDEK